MSSSETQQGQNSGGQQNGGDMSGGQQGQGSQNAGQQLQLQQTATTQNNQGGNQMQQLQVIQQPQINQLQNQAYLQQVQQLYNTQSQLIMPGNFSLNHQLNPQIQPAQIAPQIQVITAGKTFQTNQLGSPHMLTNATAGYTTIPTSAANNQAYIIGQLINSSQPSILQQHSQQAKPGEMQKVIQPQITQTHLQPQQLTWATPQFLQNPIFIRGTQPDQMFIQQQGLHNTSGSHQQYTMPLTATGQLPTSISSQSNNGMQITQQGQNQQGQQNQGQVQQQQNQSQNNPQPIQPANVMSMKSPANLQPKPPLQIQPSPSNQQQQAQQQHHHQQQQQQIQNVTMGGQQFQMIPQQSSIAQQILTQSPQTITTQVMHPTQPQQLQQQRHLTILPQQNTGQTLQPQQLAFIQQQPQQQQQHQPIKPNYTVTATAVAPSAVPTSQAQGTPTAPVPQQRAKIRKPGVGRGAGNNASPNQKVMYRPNMPNASPQNIQSKLPQTQTNLAPTGATITRVSAANSMQQQQSLQQPLKTINISALHAPPTLPDATLTPLMPQSNQQQMTVQMSQPIQVFATNAHLPTPNISITPAPPKKDDNSAPESLKEQNRGRETEKENTKMKNQSTEDDDGKQKLPKAMVKPQAQILTHVIEGFVIQEGPEPFPPVNKNGECDEPPKKKMALSAEMGKCEMCGKVDLKAKFKKNKRFCSSACAKGAKAQQNQQQNQQNSNTLAVPSSDNHKKSKNKKWGGEMGEADSTDETSSSIGDTCVSPANDHHEEDPRMNPVKWNVAEVVDFVRSLQGCCEYADDFAVQEIDGQALMLLKEDHLMSAIGMKLGPALKLCAKIEALRVANSTEQNASKT